MGKGKKKGGGGGTNGEAGAMAVPVTDDPRFASMHSAPTFQRIPKDERRFKIDPRFKTVLTDDRFRAIDGQYDKYGRKLKKDRRVVDDLSAFYTVEEDGGQEGEKGKGKGKGAGAGEADPRFRLKAGMGAGEQSGGESESDDDGSDDDGEGGEGEGDEKQQQQPASRSEIEERLEYLNRLARGEASDGSVSTSEDESSEGEEGEGSSSEGEEDEDEEEEQEGGVMESRRLEDGPVPMGEATRRLAIMNVDWDHLKAVDLLGVLLSFKPSAGRVARVTVYRSDFGIEKMAEEARLGPGFLREEGVEGPAAGAADADDDDEEDDDASAASSSGSEEEGGEDVDQEKLRAYEIQRLRYHFAVAECDSVATAAALYEEVDGLEFEASAAQLDARFVPEDVAFDGRPVRDAAEALPSNYEPPSFVTKALQQTKVECTWDLGDEERERKLTSYHKWHEMDDDDLGAYLASSSSESEAEAAEEGKGKGKGEERRKKLRSLLLGGLVGDEEEDDGEEEEEEMEFTYVPGELGKQKWARRQAEKAKEEEEAGALENETPFEAMLRKRKEKRRARREAKKRGGDGEGEGMEEEEDDFFAEGAAAEKNCKVQQRQPQQSDDEEEDGGEEADEKRRDAELELLFAGEDTEEAARDFDMRALARAEKMKGKKLKGKRRRKEAERAGAAPGLEFNVDTRDQRFAALFEGDARFGIDRTAKEYKETEGMKVILGEQAKRRRTKEPASSSYSAPAEPRQGLVGEEKGKGAEGAKKGKSLASLAQKFKKK